MIGLYADSGGQPTTLLASGRLERAAGRRVERGARSPASSLTAGTAYWISILNPADGTGTLRWRDRAGGTGGAEQTSRVAELWTALPATWATGGELDRRADLRLRLGHAGGTAAAGARRVADVAVVQRRRGRREPGGEDR